MKNRMMMAATVIMTLALLGTSAALAAPFQNGSFEYFTVTDFTPYPNIYAVPYGSTGITNWTAIGATSTDSIELINKSYWQAADADWSLDLNGVVPGGIKTTFETVKDTTYKVTFYMSGNFDGDNATSPSRQLRVQATGSDYEDYTFSKPSDWDRNNMRWAKMEYDFTATGSETTLSFISLETTNQNAGPALDKVQLSVVPLPGAIWLLGSGLLGLGAVRRFRKG
jgi:choice-of-anchor C domain-containing protein